MTTTTAMPEIKNAYAHGLDIVERHPLHDAYGDLLDPFEHTERFIRHMDSMCDGPFTKKVSQLRRTARLAVTGSKKAKEQVMVAISTDLQVNHRTKSTRYLQEWMDRTLIVETTY